MSQDLNKGNIKQAALRANLNSSQMEKIDALTNMYSTHIRLSNLPPRVAQTEYENLDQDKQQALNQFFDVANPETPGRGVIGQAAYIISRPIVEPVKAIFKTAGWLSDQVTRAYRTGSIAVQEGMNPADAWQRSGANGEQVFNPDRIQKATAMYGVDRIWVAKQIAAGIPQDKIIANAQNEEQKRLAFNAGKEGGDPLLDEAVAKVNAAKYSFGRDIAKVLLPEDLEGKSGLYTWISGTADAAFRIFLDPTLLLGKARKGYIAGKYALDKTIGNASKVDFAFRDRGITRFWDEYTKTAAELKTARTSQNAEKIGEVTGKLNRLNRGMTESGVADELIKFADSDFKGVLDLDTAKAFLSNAERVEPIFYGQPGFTIKVSPRLSEFRKRRVDFYTKTSRTFNLNKDSTDFLRNIVFDEADTRGVSSLQAARESIMGREGVDAIQAGAATAERIKAAPQFKRFSIPWVNARLDNFTRKFALIPDMQTLGDFANPRSAIAFERYARLVYGRYSSRIVADAYKAANIAEKRQMFIGLQSAVGELRGLRGTAGGRRLLDTLGTVGRDAVYTNRVVDANNPAGRIPSQSPSGFDSAVYEYQLADRLAFITPDQLDKFAARDGVISSIWGAQYSKAADDAISTFVTGTLAGPRFPVRNAIEDYLFYLANGRGAIRSVNDVVRSRRIATRARAASKELNLGVVNRYLNSSLKEEKAAFIARLDAIDDGKFLEYNAATKTWDEVAGKSYKNTIEREEAKRQVFAEMLLRDKFGDAQKGAFGSDFDKFTYEFAVYGDYQGLLSAASEGAYNFNTGNDFFSRVNKVARRKGKVIDFEIDGEAYKKAYNSFVELSPISQEGKLAWAFQIAAKGKDPIGAKGMTLLKKYSSDLKRGDSTGFVAEMSDFLDNTPAIRKLRDRFDRYVLDPNYTSSQHAAVILDDLKVMIGKADGSINDDLLDKLVTLDPAGNLKVNLKDFSLSWLPTAAADVPKTIVGPSFIPASQSGNVISDLNTRLWDWLGDANARFSRDQVVTDAAMNIRRDLQGYLDDLTAKVGKEEATRRVIQLSQELAVERVLAFVDNPAVRTQMAWSMRNFARFYRATEDAYRRLYRTVKYNPEGLQKIALTYEGISHSGFVQRDDQGEPYFIYPGVAPVYGAMVKALNVFGLGDKFVAPMPLQFGSSIRMLTPSANPESWLPTFSGPLAGLTMKTVYGISGFFAESTIPFISRVGKEISLTERYTIGEIGEQQTFFGAVLPGHVNRLIGALNRDERDSQYASAFRKAVTYLEAGGHTPSADATPGEILTYQKRLKATVTGILATRFLLGFVSPASPTTTLKSDMADWVRDNGRVNFKQVFTKLIEEYSAKGDPDPVGSAMADWVKFYPEQIPYVVNESEPVFQAQFKTSNEAANWVEANRKLIDKYPEGASFFIPQSGTFTWESYEFLKDNGYRESKPVGDFLREVFVSRSKQFYYSERDRYEEQLELARTDAEKRRVKEVWDAWSKDFKATRPLLQEEFASSAANNVKRMAAYEDLKRLLGTEPIRTDAANRVRQMIGLYENYKTQIDTVYNSRSESDIASRDLLREATISQLKQIASTDANARSVFDVLFSNFLREG
jgi:hypothetical protein